MHCYVYRCRRRAGAYLYLAERDAFERVPEPLRGQLGGFDFTLEFEFGADRRLANADPAVVRANLAERGFHLQFPPDPNRPFGADVRD
jgi:uncharacterized protein